MYMDLIGYGHKYLIVNKILEGYKSFFVTDVGWIIYFPYMLVCYFDDSMCKLVISITSTILFILSYLVISIFNLERLITK